MRAGDEVLLTWTMPQRFTNHRAIESEIAATVCRRDSLTGVCADAGKAFSLASGATGSFSELLPEALGSGAPRTLYYFVVLENRNAEPANPINIAVTMAGASPLPIRGFTAKMDNGTVLLCWTASQPGEEPSSSVIRVYRKLLNLGPGKQEQSLQMLESEPAEQDPPLEFSQTSGCGADRNIRIGESYEYRAQRVARVNASGHTLELTGYLSAPVLLRAVTESPHSTPEN
jgi:hypothetical protein